MRIINPRYKNVYYHIFYLFIAFILQSCSKEANNTPVLMSSFTVKEVIMDPEFYDCEVYDTDSISTTAATFEANELESPNITYQWKIGSDSRVFTTKSVTLDFFRSNVSEVDVTLTVTKKDIPNSTSPLTLTSTRRIFFKKETQIPGIYRGVFHFRNGDDSATVQLQKDFCLPKYDDYWKPYYKGTLISTTMPQFDTLFVSQQQPQTFLNRRYYVNEQDWSMTAYPEINKKVINFKGIIEVTNNKNILMKIEAKETNTNKAVMIYFEGIKIN